MNDIWGKVFFILVMAPIILGAAAALVFAIKNPKLDGQ